jgi:hypothetical protein
LAISVIRSGIGGQGKNADKHFAAVNPESQARTGAINLAGMMYTPTTSKKGESANAAAPRATAAMIPTPADEKNNFGEVGNFTSKSSAGIG